MHNTIFPYINNTLQVTVSKTYSIVLEQTPYTTSYAMQNFIRFLRSTLHLN